MGTQVTSSRTLIGALVLLVGCALLDEAADQYDAFVQWEHAPRFVIHPATTFRHHGRKA